MKITYNCHYSHAFDTKASLSKELSLKFKEGTVFKSKFYSYQHKYTFGFWKVKKKKDKKVDKSMLKYAYACKGKL